MKQTSPIRCATQRVLVLALLIVSILLPFTAKPAYAIGNPQSLGFGTDNLSYAAFTHVSESGDMLFVAGSYIYYNPAPTDYYANQAFQFSIVNTATLATLLSTPVWSYGFRPVGIYITAAQATSLGMSTSGNYSVRIGGNPSIFTPSDGVNQITRPISSFADQSVAISDSTVLRNFFLMKYTSAGMLVQINSNDSPATSYIYTSQGINYAGSGSSATSISGTSVLLGGIPLLSTWTPDLFQSSVSVINIAKPTTSNALQNTLTPANQLGSVISSGVSNVSTWLHVPTLVGGLAIWMIPTLWVVMWAAGKTASSGGTIAVVVFAVMMAIGAYMGLVSLAWLVMVGALLLILAVYYFFTRGVFG